MLNCCQHDHDSSLIRSVPVFCAPNGACLGVLAVVCCTQCFNALRCSEWWPFRSGIVYGWCVSGGWLVWARWIPAWAATSCLASLFSRLSKCVLALAVLGFLCCIPTARAFSRLKTSRFHLVLCLSGLRCGVDLKASAVFHFPCVFTRVRGPWPMALCSVSRMRKI